MRAQSKLRKSRADDLSAKGLFSSEGNRCVAAFGQMTRGAYIHSNNVPGDPEILDCCLRHCLECFQFCQACIPHCLNRGGKYAGAHHISVMMECASMCSLSATYMPLGDRFSIECCKLCSLICEMCSTSCNETDPEDLMMQRCVEFCQKCSESCKVLAEQFGS